MSSPKYHLRQYIHENDYEAVLQLWKTAGDGIHVARSDEPDEILKKIRRDPELFLVAECDGEIIGSVIGGFDGRRGLLYHLAVEKRHRKLGIGRELMREVESRLKEKGCLKVYLLVAHDNEYARKYYHSLGWNEMDVYLFGKEIE